MTESDNPLAGFTLHQKLIEKNLTANSMVLDPDRLKELNTLAESRGRGGDVVTILQGLKPEDLQLELAAMPVASTPNDFSYEDMNDPAMRQQPFARGMVEGMLSMPLASATP